MVNLTIASLLISTALISEPNLPNRPSMNETQTFAQQDIIIDGKRIDPTITGQTKADTLQDWKRRQTEQPKCSGCSGINPFPGESDD